MNEHSAAAGHMSVPVLRGDVGKTQEPEGQTV